MGKATKPLVILVDPDYAEHPEIVALREKGHQINVLSGVDLVLSRYAHQWHPGFWAFKGLFTAALKYARKKGSPHDSLA